MFRYLNYTLVIIDCRCFHIMESVSIPKGAVLASQNTYDYTRYTVFINTSTCEYFYNNYDDINVKIANIWQTKTIFK